MIYFVFFLTVFNIAAWIIFLIRFKKLFSTDSIIERTRDQMEQMIKDIDNATDRNTFLARETQNRIKEQLDDADKKMELYKEATQRFRNMLAQADKINKFSNQMNSVYSNYDRIPAARPYVDPDAAYGVKKMEQGTLFDEDSASTRPVIKDEITITSDGAAYKEVPLIITKVMDERRVMEAAPEKPGKKKDISAQVKKLYDEGLEVEQIAAELSCSITEVQFVIDMM